MHAQRTTGFLFIALLLALSVSCHRVRPKAPATEPFEPPITRTVSYVTGRVTFDLVDLERKINQSLGPVLVNEESFQGKQGGKWRLRVERLGPIHVRYARRRVSVSAPLQVWISNPIGLRRDKIMRRPLCALSVNFAGPLLVTENWRLKTHSRFVDYRWIEKPSIRVLGMKISVRKLADSVLHRRRADIEAALDSVLYNELRLDRHVRKIWKDIQKPLRISKYPEQMWIVPKPMSITAAPVQGNRRAITVPLQIGFEIDTRLGEEPVVRLSSRLPRLQRKRQLPETSNLRVLWFIPYANLNQLLVRSLKEQNLDLAGRKVQIKNATIYGGGRSLIVKTDVTGAVNGTLYFHGQPRYDTLSNTLRVQNVDFDVDTKEALFSAADWLLHDHLRDTLQNALILPLKKQIIQFPQKIETAFERGKAGKKTDLDIDAFNFAPQRIVIRPDGIQVLIKVESKVKLAVERL